MTLNLQSGRQIGNPQKSLILCLELPLLIGSCGIYFFPGDRLKCTEEHDRLLTPKYQRSVLRLRERPRVGGRRGEGEQQTLSCVGHRFNGVFALFDFGDAM